MISELSFGRQRKRVYISSPQLSPCFQIWINLGLSHSPLHPSNFSHFHFLIFPTNCWLVGGFSRRVSKILRRLTFEQSRFLILDIVHLPEKTVELVAASQSQHCAVKSCCHFLQIWEPAEKEGPKISNIFDKQQLQKNLEGNFELFAEFSGWWTGRAATWAQYDAQRLQCRISEYSPKYSPTIFSNNIQRIQFSE